MKEGGVIINITFPDYFRVSVNEKECFRLTWLIIFLDASTISNESFSVPISLKRDKTVLKHCK